MSFNDVIVMLRDFLWDYVLLFAFLGIGLFLTIRLRFPQFSRVLPALKEMISDIVNKVPAEPGAMTPFQSLATAVAAQVGTGNIVGVATALASGGPGAAFWMLISGFLGMATIFTEAAMAQVYRERDENGELVGGPAYYIKNGLKQKWLAYIFAIICVVALGVVGIMVQANSIVMSMESAFGFNPMIVAGVLMLVVGWILIGGMDRIAKFSETVVPIMASAYILASIIILILNLDMLIPTLRLILVGAFTPKAMAGGALGIGIKEAVRFGLSRGLFSNEAGMGSTPHSHAVARTKHPAEQGFVAMIGVFICTFVICVATVMINLLTGAMSEEIMLGWETAEAMESYAQIMTQTAFNNQFGVVGEAFLSISLSAFALTTIVGWYFFAEANVKFMIKNPVVVHAFKLVALIAIALGYYAGAGIIWDLADLAMGMMALPNIIALIFLSRKAVEVLNDYDAQTKLDAEHVHWDYKYEDIQ
ncbi:sodium:alanine symporter family protein [Facklamia sp. DSM 111018]|uniref:Sodium:alanine symporter family protein n=1 Tax=Facklamia lactis TaxID=2749967 RepID=A0ABS0LS49_9LACT|nr:sodium:alanine symporter family protein [Facklamia lactis]MBG9980808.1 sodium:alanine symporter family protein [Facklamia lactis]MBG9986829.1 sodium:alanine symporter family protein [Facklamia lactis]